LAGCARRNSVFLIEYKSNGSGCPKGGVYGELENYNWNSNDFLDKRFPQKGTVLRFYARHKILDTDFFYFGTEFICSEKMMEVIKSFRCGELDAVQVEMYVERTSFELLPKKYYLLRSTEIRSILDEERSIYELRKDLKTGLTETDIYHKDRKIYDSISRFSIKDLNFDLDLFICSEMLMGEYVFSPELKFALDAKALKGFVFINIEESSYDARLEF
jgi:hypothetical protein